MSSCASPIFSDLPRGIIEHVPINLGHQLCIKLQTLLSNRFGPQQGILGPGTLEWPHTCRLSTGKSFQLNHSVALFACQLNSKAEKHKLEHNCDYSIDQKSCHAVPYNHMVPKSLAHHFRRQHQADLAEAQASRCQQSPA